MQQPLDAKIRGTLAVIRAAIANPAPLPLREANERVAALVDELDPWTLRPDERRNIVELTLALRALKSVLASNDHG